MEKNLKEYNKMQIDLMIEDYKHLPNCKECNEWINKYWKIVADLFIEFSPWCRNIQEVKEKIKQVLNSK